MTTNPTQSPSEELRKVLADFLDQFAFNINSNKLYVSSAEMNREIDYLINAFAPEIAAYLQAYTEEIRRWVIGEDTKQIHGHNPACDCYIIENELRAFQRKTLDRIAKEWGVK